MDSDDDFLACFTAAAISETDWRHEALIRAAYLHLRDDSFPNALRRMRRGLRRLNRRNRVAPSAPSAYHETLTLAWARLVAAAMVRVDTTADFASFIAVSPELLLEDGIHEHYSPDRIRSEQARKEFVLPDRNPLPGPR